MSVGLKRVKEGRTVQTQPEGAHRSFQKASLLPSWLCFQELVFYVLAPSVVVHLCHSFALKLKKKKNKTSKQKHSDLSPEKQLFQNYLQLRDLKVAA